MWKWEVGWGSVGRVAAWKKGLPACSSRASLSSMHRAVA